MNESPNHSRFMIARLMTIVAIVALILLVVVNSYRHEGITDPRVVHPFASVAAALYGLGSMRRPWAFLWPLIAVNILSAKVDHPHMDLINTSAAGFHLGWIIGAPAGWVSRRLKSWRNPRGNKPNLQELI